MTKLDALLEQKQSQQDVKFENIKNKNSNTRKTKMIQHQSNNKEIDKLKTASYSSLVKQSIEKEDWEDAMLNLKDMVDDDVLFSYKSSDMIFFTDANKNILLTCFVNVCAHTKNLIVCDQR